MLLVAGAWAKSSKEWDENPLVRAALRPKNVEDGSFWMEWHDFQVKASSSSIGSDRIGSDRIGFLVAEAPYTPSEFTLSGLARPPALFTCAGALLAMIDCH